MNDGKVNTFYMERDGCGCNNKKHSKMPNEWLVEEYGTRKANEILDKVRTFFETVRKTA